VGWARIINFAKKLDGSVESSCLRNNNLTLKPHFEPLHNPCLFICVRLASTFVLMLLYKPSAGEPEVVFGNFYPADPGVEEE